MNRLWTFKIMLLLALAQGVLALLRAFNWVRVGTDLIGQGLVLLPVVGAVAILRGVFIFIVAGLYLLFVGGAALGRSWARGCCVIAAIVNLVLVINALFQGASLAEVILWSIIPIVLLIYLFSTPGRAALRYAM